MLTCRLDYVKEGLQEVKDGADGEGISFEGGQLSQNDFWSYVVGSSCDSVPFVALFQLRKMVGQSKVDDLNIFNVLVILLSVIWHFS